jgi:GntR family transcriptional regulator
MPEWTDNQPIFLQIRQQLIEMILTGAVAEDAALPSIRQIALDLSVNPLTVTRAYQSLVDLGGVAKKRGLGMFVQPGARATLLTHERQSFLTQDWPLIHARITALSLDPKDLFDTEI